MRINENTVILGDKVILVPYRFVVTILAHRDATHAFAPFA